MPRVLLLGIGGLCLGWLTEMGGGASQPATSGLSEDKPKPLPKVDLTWGVKIPLRDGVKLNATVYKPGGVARPRPAIVTITPYTADNYHDRAMYFAQNGYVFVIV